MYVCRSLNTHSSHPVKGGSDIQHGQEQSLPRGVDSLMLETDTHSHSHDGRLTKMSTLLGIHADCLKSSAVISAEHVRELTFELCFKGK